VWGGGGVENDAGDTHVVAVVDARGVQLHDVRAGLEQLVEPCSRGLSARCVDGRRSRPPVSVAAQALLRPLHGATSGNAALARPQRYHGLDNGTDTAATRARAHAPTRRRRRPDFRRHRRCWQSTLPRRHPHTSPASTAQAGASVNESQSTRRCTRRHALPSALLPQEVVHCW
jgi:hypothetical protein